MVYGPKPCRFAVLMRLLAIATVIAVAFGTTPAAAQGDVAQEAPLLTTPDVLNGRIYGIDSFGSTVIVGGTFTSISNAGGAPIDQPYLFKFDVNTGQIDMNFLPEFDRNVESVQISDDGQFVYVGGNFSRVDGVRRVRLVKLNMSDGSIVSQFKSQASARVTDIALAGDVLFAGGRFSKVNGEAVDRFVGVDSTTGDLLPGFSVAFTGTNKDGIPPYIQEMELSADGQWMALGGNFTAVNGQPRGQVAVLNITSTTADVSSWSTQMYTQECGRPRSTYIRGIDIDPNSEYFVVNTTAWHRGITMPCDSAMRWELPISESGADSVPTWSAYTGGDTHWAVEITEAAVYVGGHQRWENNPFPSPRGDHDGPGALERKGIAALDPISGVPLSWDPGRHRGRGVEAMHAGDGFFFVGSDTAWFNGKKVERLAVLPVDGSWVNPAPVEVTLPATLHVLTGATAQSIPFDGATFGAPTPLTGLDFSNIEGAFALNGDLISFRNDNAYYTQSFDGTTFGAATNLSTTVGYIDTDDAFTPYMQPIGVAETTQAAYYDGRIFYIKDGSQNLHWRWYSLESGVIGGIEFVATAGFDWSNSTGMTVIDGQLYAAFNDNALYRLDLVDGSVANSVVIDDGSSGINWSTITGLFSTQ